MEKVFTIFWVKVPENGLKGHEFQTLGKGYASLPHVKRVT